MMQHVATAKSDIAAFATGLGASPSQNNESNEQFGQLLQEQTAQHSNNPASQDNTQQSTSKNPTVSSVKGSVKESETTQVEAKDVKTSSKDISIAAPTVKQAITDPKVTKVLASDKKINLEHLVSQDMAIPKVNIDELSILNSEVKNAMAQHELRFTLTEQDSVTSEEFASDLNAGNVETENWLALVENLQRFADFANAAEKQITQEQLKSLSGVETELSLPNDLEPSLLEKEAESQVINQLDITSGLLSMQEVAAPVVINQIPVESSQKEQLQSTMSSLVQQTLQTLTGNTETLEVPSELTRQQAAELLLSSPKVMQSLIQEFDKVSQKTDMAINETQATIDDLTANLLQQSSNTEQLASSDLLLSDNQALLNTILLGSEVTASEVTDAATMKTNVLPKMAELAAQKQPSELNVVGIDTTTKEQIELEITQQSIVTQQPSFAPVLDTSITEHSKNPSDVKLLSELPEDKLTKVLEHIVGRIMESNNAADVVNSEQTTAKVAQQVFVAKAADFNVLTDTQTKDVMAWLKSGIEEFKAQMAQGREPGIDLKSLVTDAIAKSNDAVTAKTSVRVEQITNSVSQVLDFAQSLNRSIENHQEQTYNATLRDIAQIQGEQSKNLQFNQLESKFEKAVNISKPEGFQQLAEKVRWMVNSKNLVAEIRLDPAELGSVHVKVAMSGESATVNFVVQSQQARDAVDTATPRLKEMLAEKGIELGQSSVRQESDEQQGQGEGEFANQGGHGHHEVDEVEVPTQVLGQQNIVNGALGGIDYFV